MVTESDAIDIDGLIGMKVNTMWDEENNFQFVNLIKPLGEPVDIRRVAVDDVVEGKA